MSPNAASMFPSALNHIWITVGCALLVVLGGSWKRLSTAWLTTFGVLASGAAAAAGMQKLTSDSAPVLLLSGTVVVDSSAVACSVLCALSTAAVLASSLGSKDISQSVQRHWTGIVLLTSGALMLAAHANHLATLLVASESAALGLVALVGMGRAQARGSEAASKAVVVGAVAFGLCSLGMALIYGGSGGVMSYDVLASAFSAKGPSTVATLGAFLVVAAFLFRLGAAPFHMAAPDLLDGAPIAAAMFCISAFRVCMGLSMLRLLRLGFLNLESTADVTGMATYLAWAAALSMLIGSVGAVRQEHLKRMFAYLAIGQLGFGLLAMVALSQNSPASATAVGACFLSSAIAHLVAFASLTYLSEFHDGNPRAEDLIGLAHERPWLAFALSAAMATMAGLPFTVGFTAVLPVLLATFSTPFMIPLGIVGLAAFLIGLYPMLRLMVAMYFRESTRPWTPSNTLGASAVVFAGTCMLLLFGFVTAPWLSFARLLVP